MSVRLDTNKVKEDLFRWTDPLRASSQVVCVMESEERGPPFSPSHHSFLFRSLDPRDYLHQSFP